MPSIELLEASDITRDFMKSIFDCARRASQNKYYGQIISNIGISFDSYLWAQNFLIDIGNVISTRRINEEGDSDVCRL